MCGRVITTGTWAEYRKYMNILPPEVDQLNDPQPNYNTAPSSTLDIITNRDDQIGIDPVVWGFVPFWAKDAKFKPINATCHYSWKYGNDEFENSSHSGE